MFLRYLVLLYIISTSRCAPVQPLPPSQILTKKEIKHFLDFHNKHREAVLQGKIPGQPAALKMPLLEWDEGLAEKAANWSHYCIFKHDENEFRKPANYTYVGQNIAVGYDLQSPLDLWYQEYQHYNIYDNTCSKVCGHYTQLVWAKTTHLGCGYTNCEGYPGFNYQYNIVCNYGPGGNIGNMKPYEYAETTKAPTTTTTTPSTEKSTTETPSTAESSIGVASTTTITTKTPPTTTTLSGYKTATSQLFIVSILTIAQSISILVSS